MDVHPKPQKKSSRLGNLRNTIMAGVTVIAPLYITFWVIRTLFRLAESISAPLIDFFALRFGHPEFYIPGLAFLLTFFMLWVVGLVAANVVGRRLIRKGRETLAQMPLVRTIYAPVQRLMETMTSSGKGGFKKAVLVEYPREGIWTLGFVAGSVPWENDMEEPADSVFVPTAPNPTTGFMLIVPQSQMRHAAITVEEAFQMIISAGVAVPETLILPEDAKKSGGETSN
jgi:uncharacterized membrane protein